MASRRWTKKQWECALRLLNEGMRVCRTKQYKQITEMWADKTTGEIKTLRGNFQDAMTEFARSIGGDMTWDEDGNPNAVGAKEVDRG